jgi:hypothetical protein
VPTLAHKPAPADFACRSSHARALWPQLGDLEDSLRTDGISAILGAVELALDVAALYLLFGKLARQWFVRTGPA